MALQLGPVPNFNVNIPQPPNALEQAQRFAGLRALGSEEALRQSLAPLQIQEQQQKVIQQRQANTLQQMAIDSNRKMMEFVASGGLSKFVGKNSDAPEGSSFDSIGALQELERQGVMPDIAQSFVGHFQNIDKANSEIAKNYGTAAADFLKNRATAHTQLADTLDEALHSENPTGAIPIVIAKFLRDPQGLSSDEINGLRSIQGLRGDALVKATQLASATLNLGAQMDAHHAELGKTAAEAEKAGIEAKEAAAEATGQVTPKMATAQRQKIEASKEEAKAHAAAQAALLQGSALDQSAQRYLETGQLPAGMRSPGMSAAIINRAGEIGGGQNIAANTAAYKANQQSYENVTKTLDTLSAFEQTGLKNLKQFTDLAAKIPDTGVPWVNTPVRALDEKLVGSANMAAVNAARSVALREIARVTNDPKLSGQLSDHAREEVENLIPKNATFNQIKAVANVLQQDMANVHGSLAAQKADIGKRLGLQAGPEQANAGHVIQIGDKQYQYKGTGDTADLKNYTEVKK